ERGAWTRSGRAERSGARLCAHTPQALRRGADGRPPLRRRPRSHRRHRRAGQAGDRPRRAGGDRRRRRQRLPGPARRRRGDGPGHRRLHGDARHRPQRARPPGRARADRRAHPRAVGDHHLRGGRALHPPPGHAPPREGADRHLRGRYRQPVLHHRHRRRPAGARDPRRGHPHGQERGRGRVRRRPAREPRRALPRGYHPPRGDRAPASGHGLDGAVAVHGQRAAAARLQHGRRAQHRPDSLRRARGNGGVDM
ncbi:MAG: Uridine monophosphate kinase, partial [uncultured Solirubrobacterales bacterium]